MTRRLFFLFIIVVPLLMAVSGCRTVREGTDERRDSADSVRIEYREKVVEVPVTVTVYIPEERKERETGDTASHLATRFAESWARLRWRDGRPTLYHSLENIPQAIEKNDSVAVTEKERTVWRTRRVTYTKTVVREKQLTRWQRMKIEFADFIIVGLVIIILVLGTQLVVKVKRPQR